MYLSKYNKSFDIKKRILNRSQHKNVQLPYINKTIDIPSLYQSQQVSLTYVQKFQWVKQQKNYSGMKDNQLYKQYQQLRKQIFNLNDLVVRQLQRFQRKADRKKLVTQIQPQKLNQIRQKQIQNNLYILQRMKKEYQGLRSKQQTMQSKDTIEQEIDRIKQQISEMKAKINSLRLKNKSIGDSIINTDQVLIQLRQSERQYEQYLKKKKYLQAKLDKIKIDTQTLHINLNKINNTSTSAQQFMKNKQSNQRHLQSMKQNAQVYNQKTHALQILKKNHQIFYNLKQQKYHQLLKLLQSHIQKQTTIKNKSQSIDYSLIQSADQIKSLQIRLKQLKHQNSSFEIYNNSLLGQSPQKSIDSQNSLSSKNINLKTKSHLFPINRHQSVSSRKSSKNRFIKKQIQINADQTISQKLIKTKINTINPVNSAKEKPQCNTMKNSINNSINTSIQIPIGRIKQQTIQIKQIKQSINLNKRQQIKKPQDFIFQQDKKQQKINLNAYKNINNNKEQNYNQVTKQKQAHEENKQQQKTQQKGFANQRYQNQIGNRQIYQEVQQQKQLSRQNKIEIKEQQINQDLNQQGIDKKQMKQKMYIKQQQKSLTKNSQESKVSNKILRQQKSIIQKSQLINAKNQLSKNIKQNQIIPINLKSNTNIQRKQQRSIIKQKQKGQQKDIQLEKNKIKTQKIEVEQMQDFFEDIVIPNKIKKKQTIQKLDLDLGDIQKNIDKVSKQRQKVKQNISKTISFKKTQSDFDI